MELAEIVKSLREKRLKMAKAAAVAKQQRAKLEEAVQNAQEKPGQ